MTLRKETLLIVGSTIALLADLVFIVSSHLLLRKLGGLDGWYLSRNMARIREMFPEHLAKPYRIEELSSVFHEVLGGREGRIS